MNRFKDPEPLGMSVTASDRAAFGNAYLVRAYCIKLSARLCS
jgi:hypothetical protein